MSNGRYDVLVVGDGIAGLSAGIFTSRQGLETAIIGTGESMLGRNAHVENYPGFPQGINPDLLLDLLKQQFGDHGGKRKDAQVTDVDRHPEEGFVLETDGSGKFDVRTKFLVGATAGNADYLRNLDLEIVDQEHGAYVKADEAGLTSIDGLFVAGGLANKPLQAVISAGHGAEVGVRVLEESEVSFVHDWTVPDGFFSDEGGNIPPGCEEITEEQRKEREERSLTKMTEVFSDFY